MAWHGTARIGHSGPRFLSNEHGTARLKMGTSTAQHKAQSTVGTEINGLGWHGPFDTSNSTRTNQTQAIKIIKHDKRDASIFLLGKPLRKKPPDLIPKSKHYEQ